MTWLVGIFRALLGFFTTAIPAWLAGIGWMRRREQKKALKVREKQLDIASEPNKHRGEMLDEMRKGRF